jgi:hypothetical protein
VKIVEHPFSVTTTMSSGKLALPAFLKLFTSADVPMPKAMAITKLMSVRMQSVLPLAIRKSADVFNLF